MKIIIRLYRKKKVLARRIGKRENWPKLYGKLASAGAHTRYFVRVEYGKDRDVTGETVMFYNTYDGEDKKEAKHALKAFIEK